MAEFDFKMQQKYDEVKIFLQDVVRVIALEFGLAMLWEAAH